MPFFTELQTIVSNRVDTNNNSGGLNRNNTNSRYNTRTLQFPLDIGAADKGHYLMFNINAQKKTQFSTTTDSGVVPTVIQNIKDLQGVTDGSTNILNTKFNEFLGKAVSSIAGSNFAAAATSALTSPFPNEVGTVFQNVREGIGSLGKDIAKTNQSEFLRTIKRIQDTVVLYMPNKITYSNAQQYTEISLGGSVVSLAGFSAAAQSDPTNLATFAAFLASEVSPVAKKELDAIATAVTGVVKNPMLEVMYKGVSLRKFNFSFSLWPRSEKEAKEVQKIIELLRFHQAPEIKNNTGGFFLIPPSEFDISFMYNGKINPNMERISTCVLTNIATDYTPKGFHTYESIGSIDKAEVGETGMPVGINLTLSFLETQIITKDYYSNGITEQTRKPK